MVALTHHHENDDLLALGICFIAGTVVLIGAVALAHIPSVQALLDHGASLVWQAVRGTFRVPRP